MRILYQPTQDSPSDWQQTDEALWAGLNSFTCHAVCVQGVTFDGADHYSVEPVSPGVVRIIVWYDDPGDWPAGQRWAREWTFSHLSADPDPRYGGAIRPQHQQVIYAEDGIRPILKAAYGSDPTIKFKPWAAFDPNRPNPMHGAWVSDAQHADQQAAQSTQGWRTWTEGVDPSDLDSNGHIKDQRSQGRYEVPKGTRTYYHNTTTSPDGPIGGPDFNNVLGLSPAGAGNQVSGGVNQSGRDCWEATTPAGEPASAAWPTTGDYRYQIDCVAAGADLTYGLLTQGTQTGAFFRNNAANTSHLQTLQQDQPAFSGSGLNIASMTNPAWTAGSASDRFGIEVAAVRVVGHGTQTMTLQLGEADDFADGPWPSAPSAPTQNATFFGTAF
jgi:hypothetical protein